MDLKAKIKIHREQKEEESTEEKPCGIDFKDLKNEAEVNQFELIKIFQCILNL